LHDDKNLSDYGIETESVLHQVDNPAQLKSNPFDFPLDNLKEVDV
jgi:hypothetical protein